LPTLCRDCPKLVGKLALANADLRLDLPQRVADVVVRHVRDRCQHRHVVDRLVHHVRIRDVVDDNIVLDVVNHRVLLDQRSRRTGEGSAEAAGVNVADAGKPPRIVEVVCPVIGPVRVVVPAAAEAQRQAKAAGPECPAPRIEAGVHIAGFKVVAEEVGPPAPPDE
jgi:hypothetical protein